MLFHHHGRADRHPLVEIRHVHVAHAETAGRFRLTDRVRIGRAVDPVERAAEIHRVRAERIVRIAALHAPRHILLPRDHLRRRGPIRLFLFRRDLVRALPLEAVAADADAVAQRRAAGLNEIEPPRRRIDHDGARRIFARIADRGAAKAGAVQAEDVVDALLLRAAAQHLQPLAVGLGVRETDGTQQGGDCGHSRKVTCQHELLSIRQEMVRRYREKLRSLPCEDNCPKQDTIVFDDRGQHDQALQCR